MSVNDTPNKKRTTNSTMNFHRLGIVETNISSLTPYFAISFASHGMKSYGFGWVRFDRLCSIQTQIIQIKLKTRVTILSAFLIFRCRSIQACLLWFGQLLNVFHQKKGEKCKKNRESERKKNVFFSENFVFFFVPR